MPAMTSPAAADGDIGCEPGGVGSEYIVCLITLFGDPARACTAVETIIGGEATFTAPATCTVVVTDVTGTTAAGQSDQVFTRTETTTLTFDFASRPIPAPDVDVATGCLAPSGQPLTAAAAARIPACAAN